MKPVSRNCILLALFIFIVDILTSGAKAEIAENGWELQLITQPGPDGTLAEEIFADQPVLSIVNGSGDIMMQTGNISCPWMVFVDIAIGDPEAELFGITTVPFVYGVATYTNLGINLFGDYVLRFCVLSPENLTDVYVKSNIITIDPPRETYRDCSVDEGSIRFNRIYAWGENCSHVCLGECDDGEAICSYLDCCGPHAFCNSSQCVCNTFEEYNGHSASDIDYDELLNPVVNCMPNYIEIRLDKCGMNALGLYLDGLYVFGDGPYESYFNPMYGAEGQFGRFIKSCELNDCRGYLSPSESGVAYSFIIQGVLSDCNADVQITEEHIIYKNVVRGFGGTSDGPVSWRRKIGIEFSCKYWRRLFRTLEYLVDPFIRTIVVNIHDEGSFIINFGVWLDPMYEIPAASPPLVLHVPDYIYLGLEISEVLDAYLFLEECKATLTNDYDDPVHYMLIENGCATDELTVVAMNGETNVALFAMETFVFSGYSNSTTLWIHCRIQICVTDHEPCTADCGARKRRSISSGSTHTVALGPITTVLEERKHSRTKRTFHTDYADSFSSMFSTQELVNPPVERTVGVGSVTVKAPQGSG